MGTAASPGTQIGPRRVRTRDPATTLGPLIRTLTAMHGEPMCALLPSSVKLAGVMRSRTGGIPSARMSRMLDWPKISLEQVEAA